MHDPGLAGFVERLQNLLHIMERQLRGGRAFAADVFPQIQTFHVFLGDEMQFLGLAHDEHLHDVGMRQTRRRTGLALESLQKDVVRFEFRPQHLDRHLPAQRGLFRQIDLRHPAASQQSQQTKFAEHAVGEILMRDDRLVLVAGGPVLGRIQGQLVGGIRSELISRFLRSRRSQA